MNSHITTLNSRPDPFWAPLIIRRATAGDRDSLERLAQLDSRAVPAGDTLVGELQGRPVVALSLTDGTLIADPFVATGDISELVFLRAQQLTEGAKASSTSSKRSSWETRSILPMYRRLSAHILRTA
jgi:hypothetical protein